MTPRILFPEFGRKRGIAWASWLCLAWVLLGGHAVHAQRPALLPFTAKAEVVFKQLVNDPSVIKPFREVVKKLNPEP